jgi:hypothetical protein
MSENLWAAFRQHADRRRIAVHEASHVVAARSCRLPVSSVTISASDLAHDRRPFGRTMIDTHYGQEDAIVALAGAVGEQIAADRIGGDLSPSAEYDLEVVRTSLRPGGLTFDQACGRALYTLLADWDDVERLANALLAHPCGRLNAAEIDAVLGQE